MGGCRFGEDEDCPSRVIPEMEILYLAQANCAAAPIVHITHLCTGVLSGRFPAVRRPRRFAERMEPVHFSFRPPNVFVTCTNADIAFAAEGDVRSESRAARASSFKTPRDP